MLSHDEECFSELHCVSDLHLGGPPGRQIFDQGGRLAKLIDHLRARKAPRLGLVINGDVVDFLAEDSALYLDPTQAIFKLSRIMSDPAFSEVWRALKDFVATPSRCLILVLGNHDVELALPHVRAWLTERLSNGDEAARGRILWAVDGDGFACRVGDRRVLCLHGNEVDDWNVVDYWALVQLSRALNRGVPLPKWIPNAGTRLVVDLMNRVKRDYPMVDLLKPETKAALPVLVALRGITPGEARSFARALARQGLDGLNRRIGTLGADGTELVRPTEDERLAALMDDLRPPKRDQAALKERILTAQLRIERGEPRLGGFDPGMDPELLGITAWLRASQRPEALREALEGWLLKNDISFELTAEDKDFRALDEKVGSSVQYLLAGHTHLRKALHRRSPGCYHYNTGTWVRLIELDKKTLADDGAFQHVYAAFQLNDLAALDEAVDLQGKKLVKRLPTVASIVQEAASVYGVLQDVRDDGLPVEILGTRFPR
jgi:UDP-2,3-diacylglucosamine pyrophosphatase LpxH